MSDPDVLTIHTDGASRGNPGPAAFAYVIAKDGQLLAEEAGCLGRMTNNQAEYVALVKALEHAGRLGTHHRLVVHSDSELMVKQVNGDYKVKDEGLRELYERARRLCDRFPGVVLRHVRRSENEDADRLCNEVLDGKRLDSVLPPSAEPAAAPAAPKAGPRDELLACLRAAAVEWARGNPDDPAPEAVCDRVLRIVGKSRPPGRKRRR